MLIAIVIGSKNRGDVLQLSLIAVGNKQLNHSSQSLSLYSLTKQILNVILILNRLSTVRWQTLYHCS